MRVLRAFIALVTSSLILLALYNIYTAVDTSVYSSKKRRVTVGELPGNRAVHYIVNSGHKDMETGNISMTISSRLKKVTEGCQNLQRDGMVFKGLTPSMLDHLIVNDEYKMMYCYIPKVACTNLKRVFLLLSGHMNQSDPLKILSSDVHNKYDKYLKYLKSYSKEEIEFRIRNYKKVLFVREPLERMLSAYRNKFLQNSAYFHQRFGRRIIKRFRTNASELSLRKGHDVSFQEFVQYLLDPVTQVREGYNEHWSRFYDLCLPCQIQYDFIGKYETLDEDVDFLLKSMHVDHIVKFPERSDLYRTQKTEDTLLKFYSQIPSYLLKHLWRIYYNDYLLFDYPFPAVIDKIHDSKKFDRLID